MSENFLSLKDVKVRFSSNQGKAWPWSEPSYVKAVNGITVDVLKGETLGIVGESGCGKSSLVRALAGLTPIAEGEVWLEGQRVDYAKSQDRARLRNSVQMIFQDPIASLNPRMTVSDIILEPVRAFFPDLSAKERDARMRKVMERVGIAKQSLSRYPHEFSGGQCQRIGIARALVSEPKLLICDEPVSALDVSIQAQIVNLLKDLQKEYGLTLLFVAHDLGVVRAMSDHVMVMYLGGMMEYGEARSIVENPLHPYTKALLSAVPVPDPKHVSQTQILDGDLPTPLNLPDGCFFSTRCPIATSECRAARPPLHEVEGHEVACIKV